MVHIIYGQKGTGKTKKILDRANDHLATAKGRLVFIDKDDSSMLNLSHKIKWVNAKEYQITSDMTLIAFLKGMLAFSNDIETIYVDGMARITNLNTDQMEWLYRELSDLAQQYKVEVVTTVSCPNGELPEFLKPLADNAVAQ